MKIILPHIHGIIDYVIALTLLLLPLSSIFPPGSGAGVACGLLGVFSVIMNLCTNYSMGAWHILPMHLHLLLDALISGMLIFTALFLTTAPNGSLVLICVAIIIIVHVALTKTTPQNKAGMFLQTPNSKIQILNFRRTVD